PNYSLRNPTVPSSYEPNHYRGLTIYDTEHKYRPSIFHRSVYLSPNDLYNLSDHELTLNRLVNLGVFKYVNVEFHHSDTTKNTSYLDADVYLTSAKKKALKLELNGNSRSNNFVGSGVNFSWLNRNIFRGAELFKLNVGGSFETQV